MTFSDFRGITDELLSAYIDDQVTEQERALIEAAIAQDEQIAWRLNSLRQTVSLLRDLPELALPRSFTLTLEQVHIAQADHQQRAGAMERVPAAPARMQPKAAAPQPTPNIWVQIAEGWRSFWQAGNPVLRNAAAVSFVLMLVLTGGGQLINRALTEPAGMMASAPATAPDAMPAAAAREEAAPPAAESVALAPTATEAVDTGAAEAGETMTMQAQDDSSRKAPPVADAAGAAPATESSEQAVADDEPAEDASTAQATVAGAEEEVGAEEAEQPAPAEEAAVAAAMAAPDAATQSDEIPPLEASPFPAGGAGYPGAGGMGGAGGEAPIAPGMPGGDGGLLPGEVYSFDVNPAGAPAPMVAEEAAAASVAAASAAEGPAGTDSEDVANAPATPAVDAPATATDETTVEDSAESASQAAEPTAEPTVEPTVESTGAPTIAPTVAPTPQAAALAAPGSITSSEVVEVVGQDGVVPATGTEGSLPIIWVAQGSALLLTIVLTSLWWRSRTPRRPRRA